MCLPQPDELRHWKVRKFFAPPISATFSPSVPSFASALGLSLSLVSSLDFVCPREHTHFTGATSSSPYVLLFSDVNVCAREPFLNYTDAKRKHATLVFADSVPKRPFYGLTPLKPSDWRKRNGYCFVPGPSRQPLPRDLTATFLGFFFGVYSPAFIASRVLTFFLCIRPRLSRAPDRSLSQHLFFFLPFPKD